MTVDGEKHSTDIAKWEWVRMPMLGKCLEDGHGSSNSESWC